MNNRQLQKTLQPEGTALPAGMTTSVPAEATAAAVQMPTTQLMQHSIRHTGHFTSVPSVTVPVEDIMLLKRILQHSLAQCCKDPLTCSQQWQEVVGSLPLSTLPVQHNVHDNGAAVIFAAPALQYVMYTLRRAMLMRPALLVSYVPSLSMPHALWQLFSDMRQQQRALALCGTAGWWILISRKPLKRKEDQEMALLARQTAAEQDKQRNIRQLEAACALNEDQPAVAACLLAAAEALRTGAPMPAEQAMMPTDGHEATYSEVMIKAFMAAPGAKGTA